MFPERDDRSGSRVMESGGRRRCVLGGVSTGALFVTSVGPGHSIAVIIPVLEINCFQETRLSLSLCTERNSTAVRLAFRFPAYFILEAIMPDVSDCPIAPMPMVLEIFTLIKRSVLAEIHLPEDAAELVAFWTISTWFLDALTVLPCLVITGPANEAMDVLHALSHFWLRSVRLAGGHCCADDDI
jgi:hypothetical protein